MNPTCEEIGDGALIERYLAGQLSETATEELESHFLTCGRCATELRLGLAIRKTLSRLGETGSRQPLEFVAAEGGPVSPVEARSTVFASQRRARRWLRGGTAAALAAAAVLAGLLLVRPSKLDDEPGRTHREEGIAGEAGPVLDMPVGEVARLEEFRWSPVSSADLYRITVYDAAGQLVWEIETEDTWLAPPAATEFAAGSGYFWKVAARVGWDRWVSSELLEFRIAER